MVHRGTSLLIQFEPATDICGTPLWGKSARAIFIYNPPQERDEIGADKTGHILEMNKAEKKYSAYLM